MSINNYWSKKLPDVAEEIFKNNLKKNSVILDPFLGSGTSLEGIINLDFNVKFVGVELNEMPLKYAKFNINKPSIDQIKNAQEKFLKFYNKSKLFYEFNLNSKVFYLEKIISDFSKNKKKIKTIILSSKNEKDKKFSIKSNRKEFKKIEKIYFKRCKEIKKKIKKDLLLDENSRIAIKSNMFISELYSPINFYILQSVCDEFKNNSILKIIISSILHLSKYTDLRSQSQFPFWYPKKDVLERNILNLILKKFKTLIKTLETKKEDIQEKKDFKELSNANSKSYILLNKPIQKIRDEIPNNSIDLVFSDPPYFDQVAYSEYLVIWEFFLNFKKNNNLELVQTNRKKKIISREQYLDTLKSCFYNITRKMKNDATAIIYFKDSKLNNVDDFLRVLLQCGLEFDKQVHVSKKKYTYKQNTTQDTTVVGDCLFFFKKNINKKEVVKRKYEQRMIEKIVFEFTHKYLKKNKRVKISEILDNGLIKELFFCGYLGTLKDSSSIMKILQKRYKIEKKSRNIIEI